MNQDEREMDDSSACSSQFQELTDVSLGRDNFLQQSPNIDYTITDNRNNEYIMHRIMEKWAEDRAAQGYDINDKEKDFTSFRTITGLSNVSVDYRGAGKDYVLQMTMKKMCPVFPLLWQSRFFILKRDGSLYYYQNAS